MKKFRPAILLFIGVFVATVALAQTTEERPLTRKEKKEWKRKKRKMSAEDFRNLYEEHNSQKGSIAAMESEISNLEEQISAKDTQVSDLQKQVTRMQAAYQAAQREIEQLKNQEPAKPKYNPDLINGEDFSVGVVFKVQVGAFRKMDLERYANASKEFSQEEMQELRKYVIGNFRNYEDANVLKRYLREMGVEDAWIVPYKDNQRVPLSQVINTGSGSK